MKLKMMFLTLFSGVLILSACAGNQSNQKASGNSKEAENNYPSEPIEIIVGFGEGGGLTQWPGPCSRSFRKNWENPLR